MSDFHAANPLPRAQIDPIDTPYRALAIVIEMMDPRVRAETVVLSLDPQHRGLSVLVVEGTDDPSTFLAIIDSITEQARYLDEPGGLVVATVRPDGGPEYADLDRWVEANETCTETGVELVEWFVLGRTITCPRELCDVPARWRR